MSDELDPEIAALLASADGNVAETRYDMKAAELKLKAKEDYEKRTSAGRSIHEVDLSLTCFEPIQNPYLDEPSETFNDPAYYKTALSNENQSAQRVHQILSKYLTCKDPKDRTVYRQQIVTAYWELLRGMVGKAADVNLAMPKRMLLRYAVLLPSLFRPEQKELFNKFKLKNDANEPVLYVDEWFKEISSGRMKNSMTDEQKPAHSKNMTADEAASAEQSRLIQLQSKNSGRLQNAENILNIKENERSMLETELRTRIDNIMNHQMVMGYEPHKQGYTEFQRKQFAEISDYLHRLSKNDKELTKAFAEYQEAKGIFDNVQNKIEAGGPVIETADVEAVKTEFDTVRQMAKMTIGRQGNQFPVFTREFYHCTEKGTGTRENVIEVLRWVESLDPGVFHRIHKNVPNRIVPYVLLVPTYGDRGFCWEPFDRYNRVTSRGRIVIPMYPRDLQIAVLTAVADLRWQVAKEKASYYWMEEGLTGQYFQHFEQNKLKGDVKEYFIEDYILWMTKESTGVQRLEKDVRGIFWRNMPFPKELKEDLRKRSLVYDELCKKDANREMSDGY